MGVRRIDGLQLKLKDVNNVQKSYNNFDDYGLQLMKTPNSKYLKKFEYREKVEYCCLGTVGVVQLGAAQLRLMFPLSTVPLW